IFCPPRPGATPSRLRGHLRPNDLAAIDRLSRLRAHRRQYMPARPRQPADIIYGNIRKVSISAAGGARSFRVSVDEAERTMGWLLPRFGRADPNPAGLTIRARPKAAPDCAA